MFTHIYKYTLKTFLRSKAELFWIIAFPVLLSTMFYFAFGNLYEADDLFHPIPVAVISDEGDTAKAFVTVAHTLAEEGDGQLLQIVTLDANEAMSKLETQEIYGIFYASDELSLTLSSDIKGASISQSILQSLVKQFNTNYEVMAEIAHTHPEKLADALAVISEDTSYNQEISYSEGSMDSYTQYFYNLIAMVCLYTALAGSMIAISAQANLSTLGMRKNISPIHKLRSILSELSACITLQFLAVCVSFVYIIGILRIDFGKQIPYILLTILVGCISGVTFGFFIGSIGKMRAGIKEGLQMGVIMLCCFFSGLMVGNMRMLVEQYCPLLNKINPAALITDCFYCLNIYDTYTRFYTNLATLLLIGALFSLGGFFMVRREKYASL